MHITSQSRAGKPCFKSTVFAALCSSASQTEAARRLSDTQCCPWPPMCHNLHADNVDVDVSTGASLAHLAIDT